jgi:hypothetical protein
MPKFVNDRPNLLWLEDRESTARAEIEYAKRHQFQVHLYADPREMMAVLGEEFGDPANPDRLSAYRIAFIIDLMLAGLLDLRTLGVEGNSETNGGMNAGYVFADRVLRREGSPFSKLPICLLSERTMDRNLAEDLEYLRKREGSGTIEFVKKFESSSFLKFQVFLRSL